MEKQAAPYGSWKSPITAERVAAGTLKLTEVKICEGKVYWVERRPLENARSTLICWSPEQGAKELLPKEYNIRSKVHEYGGGALLVQKEGIYFVNSDDQQIYRIKADGKVQKITEQKNARFADGVIHPKDGTLFYVMEKHEEKEVINSIVSIDPRTGKITTVASGRDFYSSPRLSPDGKKLAYISWDHPHMPWDGTELWVQDLATSTKSKHAGGPAESVVDPQWSKEGELYYISDRTNWWNIYKGDTPIWRSNVECALPHWCFARSLMGFSNEGIFCSYVKNGSQGFVTISKNGKTEELNLPFTTVQEVSVENGQAAFIASSPSQPVSVVLYDLKKGSYQILKCCRADLFEKEVISQPTAIEYPSSGRTSHAFYYPPLNSGFRGLSNETPPLLVNVHGGPTGQVFPSFNPEILFWTSRGFAYLDVNYGGSTGYGKAYRDSLKGKWGIVDVEDCTNGALYCAKKGLADPQRLTISGPSAGGYTALAVMAFEKVFKVGADYFGVSDLERLVLDTHKFESRYLDSLVAPYPEQREIYLKRSPIYNVEKISSPLIIFQGSEDAVVPPSQSEMMFQALCKRHIPTAYLLYQGEGHGFHKAENIKRSLEAQLYFFSKILKFPLSEEIEPVHIENLEQREGITARSG